MRQKFMQDLQIIYDELQARQALLNSYYELLDGGHKQADLVVDAFLSLIDIPRDDDSTMASLTRIVNLREDALEQVLQKLGLSEEEIVVKKELAYGFVSSMYITRHESLINWIEQNKLLTPFYRSLIFGVHFVGIALSVWQSSWTHHIINGINRDLTSKFGGDDSRVFEMLQEQNLLDLDKNDNVGDRCYSVLTKNKDDEYQSVAYAKAFPKEVEKVVIALEQLIALLNQHEDEVYNQKREWIEYFDALKDAFGHTIPNELISKWADVDRAWMSITTPLQVGHPLEYYEDHYRKAVALEWDLRIINPKLQEGSDTRANIKTFALAMAGEFGSNAEATMDKNLKQVDETQLYIAQPILYYGAEFNGLFSAQVVPNDEEISHELGKKIFAYSDFVMESKKSKPIMRLSVETMGEKFVKIQRKLIKESPKLWQEIYDISTIGHEFGHILWIDADTESSMNGTGAFKNIEEFKATAGGLMAFFANEREELREEIVNDVVSRAVGLMAWREVGEVLPYYCEGLIHLDILFSSQIISYSDKIEIDYSRYNDMKELYQKAYRDLVKHYLDKEDASKYLSKYTIKQDIYLPIKEDIREFVENYYKRYKEIGQQSMTLT